jgi:hypothetical protein
MLRFRVLETIPRVLSRGLKNVPHDYVKPEALRLKEIVCGFDESGKSAVLGPQIIVALTMEVRCWSVGEHLHVYIT